MTTTTVDTVEVVTGSVDYLEATITANVDLSGMPVALALVVRGQDPTWLTADWVGDPTTTGTARTSAVVTYERGTYRVRAKVTNSPAIPIIDCYDLHVVA